MICDGAGCNRQIDRETDRHLVVTERLVAPDLGVEGSDGLVLCAECMDPRCATLAPNEA